MKYRWVSWNHEKEHGGFTLNYPWWVSGSFCDFRDDPGRSVYSGETIVAAIPVDNEEIAKKIIEDSFDKRNDNIKFRFNILKDGAPFTERFKRADWMPWPEDDLKNEGAIE